jgi:hypothetical protein
MYNLYIILGDAKPGREREFDDWYHWVHVREVMEPRIAAIAAQSFRVAADLTPGVAGYRQKFLCLYENSDPEAMTGASASYSHMLMSSAADPTAPLGGGYYDTIAQAANFTDVEQAAIVVEWRAAPMEAGDLRARMNALLATPGILSGWTGQASAHQLYAVPRPAVAGIYRVSSADRAAAIWRELAAQASPPASGEISGCCFLPVSARVTRLQVLAPDAAAQEKIAKVRTAVLAANG